MITIDKIKDWDILLMGGGDLLATLIRTFEVETFEDRKHGTVEAMIDGLRAAHDKKIPIHSRMVYSAEIKTGCEMTWPRPRFCDLEDDWSSVVAVFRCPQLWNNENGGIIRSAMNKWWNAFIAGGEGYGIDNLVLFPTNLPPDQAHLVCSMATSHSLLTCLSSNGFDVFKLFPAYWMVAGKDNALEVGKVSPYDQQKVFTDLQWQAV